MPAETPIFPGNSRSIYKNSSITRAESFSNNNKMLSSPVAKPHVAIICFPAAGQINPMFEFAKLLHFHGFCITFINTDFRVLSNGGSSVAALAESSDCFRFESVPDGYSPSASDSFDVEELDSSVIRTCGEPIEQLVRKLCEPSPSSDALPPLTCVISNFLMTFSAGVEKLGIPRCKLPNKWIFGYPIDWIAGMKNIRLRDISSFIRTTTLDNIFIKQAIKRVRFALNSTGIILNTFEDVETEAINAIKTLIPQIYIVGPIFMHAPTPKDSIRLSLWEEDNNCKKWLNTQKKTAVIYVSFGSLTTLTRAQILEFAWGLADSGHPFLWIIRPNLLSGGDELPEEFIKETQGRSFFSSWCNQSEVLQHPSIGGFLTHCGWNSMLESICGGVPMICWPGFADQYTNCRYACGEWGIGIEIDEQVRREQVKELVVEVMEGERGQQMRKNATKWKELAEKATARGGTSIVDFERLMEDLNPEKVNMLSVES
ncbi:hypothetical protein Cni_G28741 [Canna indica]|uniref:Glycosyltransferase n=1 Tax=Canna indica TaxID=4628 RepID=A0AAQ3L3J2_9LILI|nr:hypothetical protein Cni_G28741 [Canna indica]